MYEMKTYIPEWAQELLTSRGALSDQSKAYRKVPLVYRAFRIRCNSIASVPVKVFKITKVDGKDVEVDWPFRTAIDDLVWMMEASQLIRGAAYVVQNAGAFTGVTRDLQVLNPHAVTVVDTRLPVTFEYQGMFDTATYNEGEIVYLREYNPDSDTQPGPGAVEVAMNDARLLYYLSKFPESFFSGGAMPTVLVAIKTALDSEIKKVEQWFRQKMQGIANAFGIAAFKADTVTTQVLTPPMKDMAMPDLKNQAREAVADAFELSANYLDDTANYATASQKDQAFWEQVIMPRARRIESALNAYLKPFKIRIKFAFEEMKAFQEDENARANSFKTYVDAGFTLLESAEIVGLDLSDELRAKVEKREADKQQAADAARQNLLLNAQNAQNPQTAQNESQNAPQDNQTNANAQQVRSALYNWKSAALAAVRTNHSANVDFDHPSIPENVAAFLRYELEACKTTDEVHAVFKKAREDMQNDESSIVASELKRVRALLEKVSND